MSPKKSAIPLFLFLLIVAGLGLFLYRFGEQWLHLLLLYLSGAAWARQLITGFAPAGKVARRFVAGETIAEALATARQLNDKGLFVTLDYLGESVTNANEASQARDEILALLDHIHQAGLKANVSLKLSQLGLKIAPQLAQDNLRQLLIRAQQYQNKVRIDMEDSPTVDTTLAIYRTLRQQEGFQNVGVVIQAYLYRSQADIRQLVSEGAWVRLCKGAYKEPADLAFPLKSDTDSNYVALMQQLLSPEARQQGVYPALATHDPKMIEATLAVVRQRQISAQAFEFQMLYGIRRELQDQLVSQGYQVRVYVPYGRAWYPYFMRRLAERPANLWFFVSNLVRR